MPSILYLGLFTSSYISKIKTFNYIKYINQLEELYILIYKRKETIYIR